MKATTAAPLSRRPPSSGWRPERPAIDAARGRGVARGVIGLVVMAEDRKQVGGRAQGPRDALAELGVALHLALLLSRQETGLLEDGVGDAALPDVVDHAAAQQRVQL